MEIEFYKTIVKAKTPKNNRERGFLGVVDETDKYYIMCEKDNSQYSMYSIRTKHLKSTFEDKFEESEFWHCHSCGNDSYSWRCMECWP